MPIYLPLILLSLLFADSLTGQSLDSLRTLLLRENPELKALAFEHQAALRVADQQTQLPDLELGLGVFVLPIETRTGPQRLRFGATQPLPWPGKLAAMAELADLRAKPLLEQLAARELALLYELEVAYYRLVGLSARMAILTERLPLYAGLEQLALSRVENARGSSVDVYRLQLQTSELERRIAVLDNEREREMITINRLLNRPANRPVSTATDLDVSAATEALKISLLREVELLDNHPLVRVFALQQEAARQAITLSELDGKPDFGLGLDYVVTGRRQDMDPPGNGRDVIMPRAMLRLPLSGTRYRAKRQEESLKINALEARRERTVDQLTAEIDQARLLAANAAAERIFLEEQLRIIDAALTVARSEYANNRRPLDELLRLQNEVIGYQLSAVAAGTEIWLQSARISRWLPGWNNQF